MSYLLKWATSNISNLLCETLGHNKKLNKLILSGQIGTFAWDFIHKAKTNCLPVNARAMTSKTEERKCRRCHIEEETMTHALQVCPSNRTIITERHNACLNLIYQAIDSPDLIITVDETIRYLSNYEKINRQRIDLYVENVAEKKIYLIDVKCPIDMPDSIAKASFKKMQHYDELWTKVKELKPSYKVFLYTFIVGALGSVPSSSIDILKQIGINSGSFEHLAKELSITSIRHSARIWHLHVSGVLINFAGPNRDLAIESNLRETKTVNVR